MSVPITNSTRAPTLLLSRLTLSNVSRTSLALLRAQDQLATGRAIARLSDDPVRAASIAELDARIERFEQIGRNLDHADAALSALDVAIGDASELVLEAKTIASAQVNFGSSEDEREGQAVIIDSMLRSLYTIANRTGVSGHLFGASQSGTAPVADFLGGFRYVGRGEGLVTDLELGDRVPVTLGPGHSIGEVAARVRGSVDLDPAASVDTRLSDLAGARGLGVTLGRIEFAFDNGPRGSIDFSASESLGDVVDRLSAAIAAYESDHGVTILGPAGVSLSGESITIDVAAGGGAGGADQGLTFFEVGATGEGVTARDLGLADDSGSAFNATSPDGAGLSPRLSWLTPVSSLAGVSGSLASIRLRNMGHVAIVDLSGAQNIQDIRNAIEGAGLGVRVEINADGTGIDVLNEVAGGRTQAMSIEEVGGDTATRLGIRTLASETLLTDFNDGRGVEVIDAQVDPISGLPDPTRDVEFSITLGDGRSFDVDLRPQDAITVGSVIARINAQASEAGIGVPAEFEAGLTDGANGIALRQDASLGGSITVGAENGSPAAEQLGLMDASWDPTSATLIGEDRARVRVDNVFTHLIDLRDSLRGDDTIGITLAGTSLERSVARLAESRALVGGYAQRVSGAKERTQEQGLIDERVRSELRDLDYTEAAVRFGLLQTQLTAALQATAQVSSRSLLDFLG